MSQFDENQINQIKKLGDLTQEGPQVDPPELGDDEVKAPVNAKDALIAEQAEMIEELQALLQKLTAKPLSTGLVYALAGTEALGNGVLVMVDGKTRLVEVPWNLEVGKGDYVVLSETGQILDKLEGVQPFGPLATVREVDQEKGVIEVESGGNIIVMTYNPDRLELSRSDRVLTDPASAIALDNLGKERNQFALENENYITWEDIGGLEDAKRDLVEAIELPLMHPELYEHYGKRAAKGLLFEGPPGCGKTLLGKAAATAVTKIEGAKDDVDAFMYVKGPEILDKYVGVAEGRIRSIFERARQFKEEHGFPCVVFIDEADAILSKRGSGVSSDMEKTIVPMFLSEMDGMDENGALIILATNRADVLDPAVIREGRIDKKIYVGRPPKDQAQEIFKVHLREKPTQEITLEELAEVGTNVLFNSFYFNIVFKDENRDPEPWGLPNLVSGAMIETVVDQAVTFALRRDIEEKTSTGLTKQDMIDSVLQVLESNRPQAKDQIKEYAKDFKDQVKKFETVPA